MKHDVLRRAAALLLALLLAVPAIALPAEAADPSVSLNRTTLELTTDGDSAELTATAADFPTGVTPDYKWTSSDSNVVNVVKVEPDAADSSKARVTRQTSSADPITITVTVTWTDPTDPTASPATATAACTVSVPAAPVAVTGVTLNHNALTLMEGDPATLTATVAPSNATNKAVSWKSSDTAVATVDSTGAVTAKGPGNAVITVTTADGGKTATCNVTVTKAPVPVTGVSFSQATIQFDRNDERSRQISVSIAPSAADFDKVEWTSSDPEVVTVAPDSASATGVLAVLTAVAPGEATIQAEVGGKFATCKVIVSGFTLNNTALTLMEGKSENLILEGPYGEAAKSGPTTWWSSDSSVVVVNSGGRLTARTVGTATITATKGDYTATCSVTVVEDTTGLVNVGGITAGQELGFGDKIFSDDQSIRDALNAISREQSHGYELSYITNLSVPAEQGTIYHNHLSEGDTGSGVGVTERFYYNPGVGQQSIEKLSFVPKNDYSGVVEIAYTGYSANRQSFRGVIRVQVGAMYDAYYSTYSGVHVTFRGSDFNSACQGLTGRDLSYVNFTLPLESRGTLYYNYPGPTQYTEKVTAGAQYRYTSNPNLNNVSFVPAEGYTGTFSITYRGVNTAGASFTGRLVITVNDPVVSAAANLYYTAEQEKQVVFRPSDFDAACRAVTGETLDYVRFTPPSSSQGALIYDYRSISSPGTQVDGDTSYYRSGSPSIGSVSFFSVPDSPNVVSINYTGCGSGGTTYMGTVYITLREVSQQTIRYTVDSGKPIAFRGDDFNTACLTATGESLNFVRFQLPAASEGLLCYQYDANRNPPYTSRVSSATSYYYTGGTRQIGNVTFLAGASHAGTVSIGYTGYTKKGVSFTGTVVIQVNLPAPKNVTFTGTAADPIRLSSSSFRGACGEVLDKELSYIQFGSLPDNSIGRLYLNYSGYNTGTPAGEGVKYYATGTPGISQLSFVPRGGYQGTVTIPYTAVSISGQQVNGQMTITVNAASGSRYFKDMGSYRWAAASADYLYQNGVTKGMSAGQYGPSLNIRRCDFVVMLCRIFNLTANSTATSSFPDVPANAYYAKEVAIAKQLGIVSGDGVYFMPNSSLTRQDAMVMLRNTLNVVGWGAGGTPASLDGFADSTAISGYAKSAVGTLVQLGVVKGDTNNRLRPRDIITRAEVAMILHSVMTM